MRRRSDDIKSTERGKKRALRPALVVEVNHVDDVDGIKVVEAPVATSSRGRQLRLPQRYRDSKN
ncbi:hypothetical protein K432DRAFT_411761 [Lepidopterella palustris CBS 459.81]|uniref:Uncharacterized protein n=1 Tax=Lepidopterella palustris CBS 459.81 TaxID=1314670 RepID=A0A8E2J7U6_9PEZI|nr:hypothetical protein K432DRAFT_411761 [Lepidopterella palustris CBS 459.81]